MKTKIMFLFVIIFSLQTNAQDKITFDYDDAGNQIKRELCISCNKSGYKTAFPKEIAPLKDEDLQKFSLEDVISYYPNPVKEELYLKWEIVDGKTVGSIYLYTLNGQVIKTYNNLDKANNPMARI